MFFKNSSLDDFTAEKTLKQTIDRKAKFEEELTKQVEQELIKIRETALVAVSQQRFEIEYINGKAILLDEIAKELMNRGFSVSEHFHTPKISISWKK